MNVTNVIMKFSHFNELYKEALSILFGTILHSIIFTFNLIYMI